MELQTPEGVPLGLIDFQVWACDPPQIGQAPRRQRRSIEEKESHRWLTNFLHTTEVQALCPNTRLVNIADREADIFELFFRSTRVSRLLRYYGLC